ncbi:hypothetical protein F5141DRAFT_289556 [Pisolithus sp. B1]|nr:hypothetical protein F5141DRAFT_289556 [Pisolithus sp. B1]
MKKHVTTNASTPSLRASSPRRDATPEPGAVIRGVCRWSLWWLRRHLPASLGWTTPTRECDRLGTMCSPVKKWGRRPRLRLPQTWHKTVQLGACSMVTTPDTCTANLITEMLRVGRILVIEDERAPGTDRTTLPATGTSATTLTATERPAYERQLADKNISTPLVPSHEICILPGGIPRHVLPRGGAVADLRASDAVPVSSLTYQYALIIIFDLHLDLSIVWDTRLFANDPPRAFSYAKSPSWMFSCT